MITNFIGLKKNCKKDMSGLPVHKMVLMGDCATQHLATAIKGYGYEKGIAMDILDTDYNQIMAQLMDPDSETYNKKPDSILIDMCSEKLYEAYRETSIEDRGSFAEAVINKIVNYWMCFKKNNNGEGIILQFNFPEADDRVYGSYASVKADSFITQLRKINILLGEKALEVGGVFIIDIAYVQNMLGRNVFHDEKLMFAAKMPYSMEALPYIAESVISVIEAKLARIKKCVVLDLDNTLWGGVIGDDGVEGIQIGELGVGHAYQAFQEWLKELTKTGIILAVCSKNDDDKAKQPFTEHPEMVLKLEDIAMFVANWQDKASNIKYIADTLNLGLDSFVFIDDNPFERNQVKTVLPMVTVPDMPEDPAKYVSYLQGLNLFERLSASSADNDRTRQYREQADRNVLLESIGNYDDYLAALDMQATVGSFDEFTIPRVAQLSQRSNQFNLRTVRYTETDVKGLSENPDYITLHFSLKDKFGDHGLISVMVIKKMGDTGFIENWFMSCRVLKRGMEQFIINTMAEKSKAAGLNKISAEYIKTPKNNMVSDIYEKMGFDKKGENTYELNLTEYKNLKTYIK